MAPDEATSTNRVPFHYLKADGFRVIHVDGGIGGLTPDVQRIHLALYNERAPIPTYIEHELKSDGTLGREIPEEHKSRAGVIRQVELSAIMSIDTALALSQWLIDRVKEAKDLDAQKRPESGRTTK